MTMSGISDRNIHRDCSRACNSSALGQRHRGSADHAQDRFCLQEGCVRPPPSPGHAPHPPSIQANPEAYLRLKQQHVCGLRTNKPIKLRLSRLTLR